MKVARYYNNEDIREDEIAKPAIGPGEILVEVKRSGICGSDILEYYRFAKMEKLGVKSLILGHEIAGDIEVLGGDITDLDALNVLEAVGGTILIQGQRCENCRN